MLKTLRQYATVAVVGALLGTAVSVFAQSGPYAAQIQSAINALLTGSYTFTNISVTGGSISGVTTTLPAGGALTWTGRSQISSPADGQLLVQNNAGTDFARLMFGGTTASFPAIKRNGAAINFRLADDSGDASVTVGSTTFSGLVVVGTNAIGANAGGTVASIMLGRLVANQIELQADNNRFNLTNTASTTGALIDTSTDGTMSLLTRGAANTAIFKAAQLQVNGTVVVGSLPTCNAGAEGSHRAVSDATATYTAGIGAAVVGGGANHVPVYCDGTSWKIG